MTAKAPEPPQESPATTTASTPAVPAQPAPAPPAAAPAPAPPKAAAAPAKATAPARPAARPAAPRARPPKSSAGVAGGAFVVAVCALLVAIGAIAVSIYSLKVARDALSKNADRAPAAAAAPTTTTIAPPAANAATPAPTATAPRVTYVAELARVELKLPPATGCTAVYVDVDTMAIGTTAGHEFYVTGCVDPLAVRVDRTSGASSSSANPSPEVCGSLISGTQTGPELVLPARTGLTFCLLTNKSDAALQNLPQRLAIVEVRDVGVDKAVTIAVSTFRVI